ncbi:hypothetical protein J1N35_018798 [Gossypium stocksii]|uniref:Uncharacterized protein n=1 Tax=Gossypium stocksii TaxID=47602 RepID=A0A9D4A7J3_9ROSI|nr:hypothetical protein J1N35_018798 [Gossypium stocksii]
MKTVRLGPKRLKSSEASELAESSIRLLPVGEVGNALDFKGKEVMHRGQLTRVTAKVHSGHLERRGPFKVLEQRGRETVGKAKPSVVNQEDSIREKLEYGKVNDITPCVEMYKRVGRLELKRDESRGKSPKGREKLRRQDEIEVN